MTKRQLLEEAMHLPESDRRELADALLDSEGADDEIPLAWQEELARRLAEMEAHPEKAIPLEEFLPWLENRKLPEQKRGAREAG